MRNLPKVPTPQGAMVRCAPSDRSTNPPRDAVLIDDSGIAVSIWLVLGLAFGRRSRPERACICRVDESRGDAGARVVTMDVRVNCPHESARKTLLDKACAVLY